MWKLGLIPKVIKRFEAKYGFKLPNGLTFFFQLFRYVNTRTFPFYYRLSRSAISVTNMLQELISSSGLKILSQTVSYDLSKFVVNLNLIIMFKPKYTCIFIFTGLFFFFFFFFFSVFGCTASGTLHFYSGFSVNSDMVWIFWPSAWQPKPRSN